MPARPVGGGMDEETGAWDRIKGKTNDVVGAAKGDLGRQVKGKGQQALGAAKGAVARLRRDDAKPEEKDE